MIESGKKKENELMKKEERKTKERGK